MVIIVEDGTGLSNANSYVSVADATTYFTDRGEEFEPVSQATGKFTMRVNPSNLDSLAIGSITYVFKTALASAYDVKIGATVDDTRNNLVKAIGLSGTFGTEYATGTIVHKKVMAVANGLDVELTAVDKGTTGNLTVTWSGSANNEAFSLEGGLDDLSIAVLNATTFIDKKFGRRWVGIRANETQALDWPRSSASDPDGYVLGDNVIPVDVIVATIEASKLALTEDLLQSYAAEDTGQVTSESVSVGPISISQSFAGPRSLTRYFYDLERILSKWVTNSGVERA